MDITVGKPVRDFVNKKSYLGIIVTPIITKGSSWTGETNVIQGEFIKDKAKLDAIAFAYTGHDIKGVKVFVPNDYAPKSIVIQGTSKLFNMFMNLSVDVTK